MHERFCRKPHWFSRRRCSKPALSLLKRIICRSFDVVDLNVIPLLLEQCEVSPFFPTITITPFDQSSGICSSSQTFLNRYKSLSTRPTSPYFSCSLVIPSTPGLLKFLSFLRASTTSLLVGASLVLARYSKLGWG